MIVFPSKLFDKGNNFSTHNQGTINFEFFAQSMKKITLLSIFKGLESKFLTFHLNQKAMKTFSLFLPQPLKVVESRKYKINI